MKLFVVIGGYYRVPSTSHYIREVDLIISTFILLFFKDPCGLNAGIDMRLEIFKLDEALIYIPGYVYIPSKEIGYGYVKLPSPSRLCFLAN